MNASVATYRDGGRRKVTEEGRCRMCLRSARIRRLTRHHLVPQRWFNRQMHRVGQPGPFHDSDEYTRLWKLRDADANIVPLCEACHAEVEHDVDARRLLRKVLGSREATFALAMRGTAWFDEMYPPRRSVAQREAEVA